MEFNMTPMIDVVFLLVIFFLLSSHLARRESQLQLPLPVASSAAADDRTTARVTLNILPNRMFLGSEPVSDRELAKRLAAAKEKQGDRLELRIRADQSIGYGQLAPALKAAAEVGLWDVNLAVLPESPS
jgi:biopolymer transport protein ExbD